MTVAPVQEALSIRQVAELLGVSQKTVRVWIRSKYIKAYRVGPHLIRIPRSEMSRLRAYRLGHDGRPKYPVV